MSKNLKGGYKILDLTSLALPSSGSFAIEDDVIRNQLLSLREYIESDYDFEQPLKRKLKPIQLSIRSEASSKESTVWATLSISTDNRVFKIEAPIESNPIKMLTITTTFALTTDDTGVSYYALASVSGVIDDVVEEIQSAIDDGELDPVNPIIFTDVALPTSGSSTVLDCSNIEWASLQNKNSEVQIECQDGNTYRLHKVSEGDSLITFSGDVGKDHYYCTFALADSTITGGFFWLELPVEAGTKLYRHLITGLTGGAGLSIYTTTKKPFTNNDTYYDLRNNAIRFFLEGPGYFVFSFETTGAPTLNEGSSFIIYYWYSTTSSIASSTTTISTISDTVTEL